LHGGDLGFRLIMTLSKETGSYASISSSSVETITPSKYKSNLVHKRKQKQKPLWKPKEIKIKLRNETKRSIFIRNVMITSTTPIDNLFSKSIMLLEPGDISNMERTIFLTNNKLSVSIYSSWGHYPSKSNETIKPIGTINKKYPYFGFKLIEAKVTENIKKISINFIQTVDQIAISAEGGKLVKSLSR